jgi:GxxExxY protein
LSRQDAKSAKKEPCTEVDELARRIIGAAIEVHRELGPGYLESVYEEALAQEFDRQEIPFQRQYGFSVLYKGKGVGEGRIDFVVAEKIVLELKAVDKVAPIHSAQVISYLRATQCELGLLINFNERLLRSGVQRIVLSRHPHPNLGALGALAAKDEL